MLIYMQKPDATLVAGFNKWRDQFERNVNKGEHGIKIIAPTPYKKKIEEQKLDPDTKLPMLDADGKVIMEEKEIKIPMYKPVTVFDVSQTSGKPLPQLANDLSGNVQDYEAFMEAIRRASPVPIEIKPIARGMDGFFSPEDQSITLREGMSEVQTVCAAIHEIATGENSYGYTDDNMQPLSKEQALELYERDVPVYMLYTDNTESMAFDAEEIRIHDGFFGVSREDWEAAKMGFEPEVDRPDYEKSFLDGKEDGFLLLQLIIVARNCTVR